MNQKVDNFLAVIAVIVVSMLLLLLWVYVPEDELDSTESCPSTSTSPSQDI